jgi:hypothetical protein
MSTSKKSPATIRQGGPGASHENAKAPLQAQKPGPAEQHHHSNVSGGGGEADSHHTHQPAMKGGKAPRQ